jgi:hypothetical protein
MIDRNKSTRRGRRVLTINSATIVRISEVTIPNRARVAGRIRNEGMLTLGSSTVSGNGTAITGVGRVAAGYSAQLTFAAMAHDHQISLPVVF